MATFAIMSAANLNNHALYAAELSSCCTKNAPTPRPNSGVKRNKRNSKKGRK